MRSSLDLTRAVNALPRNMTSQMFNAIAAVTGQGQNPNTTPAQWSSSQYGYGGSTGGGGGSSSAYHVSVFRCHRKKEVWMSCRLPLSPAL